MTRNTKEYQFAYHLYRKHMDPDHECENCGATRGDYVIRDVMDPTNWCGDHEAHYKEPWKWRKPARVDIIPATGLCRTCQNLRNRELTEAAS